MATFLEAEWRYLAMAHYRVEPALLTRFVPPGTELDDRDGVTFVSLVGFRFLNMRVMGLKIPFHRNFDEINLRIYVRREVDGDVRRGIVFIKEIVANPTIAAAARLTFNERYAIYPTRSRAPREAGAPPTQLQYEWRSRSGWNRISVEAGDDPFVAAPGSQDRFLTDRPWGYTLQRDGGTFEYHVDHPPWRLWRAREPSVDCHAAEVFGAEFQEVIGRIPDTATIAEGSAITLSFPTRIA